MTILDTIGTMLISTSAAERICRANDLSTDWKDELTTGILHELPDGIQLCRFQHNKHYRYSLFGSKSSLEKYVAYQLPRSTIEIFAREVA